MRGPGETQLETDRRLIRARIKSIHKRLDKVRQQRDQGRQARQRAAVPTVSLVGYTNAGKSTLFNQLTGEATYAEDKLFATLDPTLRRVQLPGYGNAVVADTVGFIRHLPHDLVQAFQATLEETRDASLLLHVIDLSNPHWRDNAEQVQLVLKDIGAEAVPQLTVFNKIDCIEDMAAHVEKDESGKPGRAWVSAMTAQGMELLLEAIGKHLFGDPVYRCLCLTPNEGKLRAQLYNMNAVTEERIDENGNWLIHVKMSEEDLQHLLAKTSHLEPPTNEQL